MNTAKILLIVLGVIIFLKTNLAHDTPDHQYVVKQVYYFLEYAKSLIPEPRDKISHSFSGAGNDNYPWENEYICVTTMSEELGDLYPLIFVSSSKDSKKSIYLGMNGGYRFNINSTPPLNSNGYFGFLIEVPFSDRVSLQPEVNFWKTEIKNPIHRTSISVIDIPLNLILNTNLENKGFSFLFGLGMMIENNKNDKLISLNFGGSFWLDIAKSLRIFTQIRLQKSGSLEAGGGDSITSLLLGIGLQIPFNPNN